MFHFFFQPGFELRLLSETETTLTLGWDVPFPLPAGYRFSRSDQETSSHTWDGARSSVRFGKGANAYKVEALSVQEEDLYAP